MWSWNAALCNLRQVFDGGSFVESSRRHEPRLGLLDAGRMYIRAVFLGFGCIECLVARLSKVAVGYTVTYSPESQRRLEGCICYGKPSGRDAADIR